MLRFSTLVMMLACMVVTVPLFAEPALDDRKTSPQQSVPKKRSPAVKQDAQQPAKPAATFNPSEKISADSAVSFPVDI